MHDDNGILTSDTSRRMLGEISPIYGGARRFLMIFNALGGQMQQLNRWCAELKNQGMPQTVTWALPIWEAEYAIKSEGKSESARRALLLSKIRSFAATNPWAIIQRVTAVTGYETHIIENSAPNEFTVCVKNYWADAARIDIAVRDIKPAHLTYKLKFEQYETVALQAAMGVHYGMRYCLTAEQQ